jgi:hypothetical protein
MFRQTMWNVTSSRETRCRVNLCTQNKLWWIVYVVFLSNSNCSILGNMYILLSRCCSCCPRLDSHWGLFRWDLGLLWRSYNCRSYLHSGCLSETGPWVLFRLDLGLPWPSINFRSYLPCGCLWNWPLGPVSRRFGAPFPSRVHTILPALLPSRCSETGLRWLRKRGV